LTRLEYALDGAADGPVVVFANPMGAALGIWEPQLEALDGFRVLRYDHRGQGSSEVTPGPYSMRVLADDLVSLLDERGIAKVSLCGLSLGGAVAMYFAVSHPDRLDRLVLACTSARFGEPEPWLERAATVRRAGIGPLIDAVLARWFAPGSAPEIVAAARAQLETTPVEGYAACCEALADWDFRTHLGNIRAPTLVIAGAEDNATPLDHAELIAEGIGAPLVAIDGAAHLASVEQPAAFNAALIEHLTKEMVT
jgi:3-oxoadipate enol-lactonase